MTLTSEPEIKACDSKQAWRERHVSAVVLDVRFKNGSHLKLLILAQTAHNREAV